ncbi:MAG: TetR/AcrR family transcriptional regulator [Bacteroidales bacterium]|nr:TetR/AcrR family transcriptional regulator [Bacteroidales bacterium]
MELTESIVNQASELFLKRGLKAVSMDDIAKAVGISKRTLYENFNSKDELLSDCINHMETSHKAHMMDISKKAKDVIDVLIAVLKETAHNLDNISPLFLQDLNLYHFRVANDLFTKHRDEQIEGMKQMIIKGKKEGLFIKDIDETLVSEILANTQRGSMGIISSGKHTYEKIFRHTVLCFIRGIATERGRQRIDEEYVNIDVA